MKRQQVPGAAYGYGALCKAMDSQGMALWFSRQSSRPSRGKSYDREIGTCALSDGRDIGRYMIAEGYCGRYR